MLIKIPLKVVLFIFILITLIRLIVLFTDISPWPMYRLSAFILITFIVLYLMLPSRGNGVVHDIYQGLIVFTATIFITIHSILIWGNPNYAPYMTVIPFFLIINKFNENIVKPVIEVDWGQVVIVLTVVRLLLYTSDKLKILSMKDLKHP